MSLTEDDVNSPEPESEENSTSLTPPERSVSPAINEEVSPENKEQASTDDAENAESPQAIRANAEAYIRRAEEMMNAIVAFLRKYLVADDYQLDILALWIAHARCFNDFPTTAYLDIRSPEAGCGKSRCLELLRLLCEEPWYASGPSPQTILEARLKERSIEDCEMFDGYIFCDAPYALLIDDCHHSFGPSERQQVLAMLTSGTRKSARYVLGGIEYCTFGPKAFAGNARLPRSLESCCIPILLKRKKPSDVVNRFDPEQAREEAAEILDWLEVAVGIHSRWITDLIEQGPPKMPAVLLGAHEQDCAEPLLYIADAVAGSWPQRARAAIIACSKLVDKSPSIQVLSDIRACFFMKSDPEYLLSRDLLPILGGMDHRPWAGWTRSSGRRLGHLLRHFGIKSKNLTIGAEKLKGYLLKDFGDAWERYLQPFPNPQDLAERDRLLAAGGSV